MLAMAARQTASLTTICSASAPAAVACAPRASRQALTVGAATLLVATPPLPGPVLLRLHDCGGCLLLQLAARCMEPASARKCAVSGQYCTRAAGCTCEHACVHTSNQALLSRPDAIRGIACCCLLQVPRLAFARCRTTPSPLTRCVGGFYRYNASWGPHLGSSCLSMCAHGISSETAATLQVLNAARDPDKCPAMLPTALYPRPPSSALQ